MAAAVCCSSDAAVGGVEAQGVGELRQVDALGARDGVVGADDGEGQHIEVAPGGVGGDAGDDLGERPGLGQLRVDVLGDASLLRVPPDRLALGVGQRAVGTRRRDSEPHHAGDLGRQHQRRHRRSARGRRRAAGAGDPLPAAGAVVLRLS